MAGVDDEGGYAWRNRFTDANERALFALDITDGLEWMLTAAAYDGVRSLSFPPTYGKIVEAAAARLPGVASIATCGPYHLFVRLQTPPDGFTSKYTPKKPTSAAPGTD